MLSDDELSYSGVEEDPGTFMGYSTIPLEDLVFWYNMMRAATVLSMWQ